MICLAIIKSLSCNLRLGSYLDRHVQGCYRISKGKTFEIRMMLLTLKIPFVERYCLRFDISHDVQNYLFQIDKKILIQCDVISLKTLF